MSRGMTREQIDNAIKGATKALAALKAKKPTKKARSTPHPVTVKIAKAKAKAKARKGKGKGKGKLVGPPLPLVLGSPHEPQDCRSSHAFGKRQGVVVQRMGRPVQPRKRWRA